MYHLQPHQEIPKLECSPLEECHLDEAGVEEPLEVVSVEIQTVEEVCLEDTVPGLVPLKACLLNPLHPLENNMPPHSPP